MSTEDNQISAKEITLRFISSLERRITTLQKREWIWVSIIFTSIGVNMGQYIGII